MANSWTKNLGIDGYTMDISAKYTCMLQTQGGGGVVYWQELSHYFNGLTMNLLENTDGVHQPLP